MKKIARRFRTMIRRIQMVKNWPWFFWPLSHAGRSSRTVVLRSGGRITLRGFRSTDYAIFNEVAIDDVYHIADFPEPERVIDVGANIGVFSILVAKRFPNAKVFAFEPERENFEILKRNVEASKVSNIVLVNKAVAARAGTATLHISAENTGAHNLYGRFGGGGEGTQTVETAPLSEFLPADILKVDAEGAEYEIFERGIPDCALIVMELHNGDDARLLERFGSKYSVFAHDPASGPIYVFKHRGLERAEPLAARSR